MGRSLVVALLLLGSLVTGGSDAGADDDKTERARIHLKAAIAYYDEARYDDAVREMETAYQLKPLADLQYNLAQCYERLGRYEAAAAAYEKYAQAEPADRKVVETRIANLRARAAAVAAGQTAPPPPTEKVVFKTLVVYRTAPPPPGRGVRIAALGAGVLALGALASGVAFAVLASQEADKVTRGGSTVSVPPFSGDAEVAQRTGQTDVIVSGVSFGVAALAAGGALGLYLLGNKIDRDAPKLTLAPSWSPGRGGGLVAAGRF
jgi:tetratricopeptide repeat protein